MKRGKKWGKVNKHSKRLNKAVQRAGRITKKTLINLMKDPRAAKALIAYDRAVRKAAMGQKRRRKS
jgi:hypothetical protein